MGAAMNLFFSFHGRINRAKYWLAVLVYTAIGIVVAGIGFIMLGNGILELADEAADEGIVVGLLSKGVGFFLLALVVYVPMIVSGIFIGIKRLHDRDKSGWWLLVFYVVPFVLTQIASGLHGALALIPSLASLVITIWGLVVLGFLRGTAGSNKYGPDPLAA
jgi:uncharacterized membrane protein YhaH (DUF805 family)